MLKTIGKVTLKVLGVVGILGVSGLGVKIANDIGNSAYKDVKNEAIRAKREFDNRKLNNEEE